MSARRMLSGMAYGAALVLMAGPVAAEDGASAPAVDPQLEARMNAEKEARKQCKTDICKVFASRSADGGPISCEVTKTFLGNDISQKFLGGRISWPWGNARCATHVELDRAALVKLISEPEVTVKLKAHELKCTVESGKPGQTAADAYVLKMSVAPEVTFKKGQATNVKLNWSNIDAPLLAQGAIWSATTLDSAVNVMGGSAVTQINEFVYDRCKEVGVEVAQPK